MLQFRESTKSIWELSASNNYMWIYNVLKTKSLIKNFQLLPLGQYNFDTKIGQEQPKKENHWHIEHMTMY